VTWPSVSCYCNTYGRVHTLEEVIESFLRQDYQGAKELVIFNDLAEQELVYDHPEVRIINLKDKIVPLGRKFNHSITYCHHDILACWEDDDIYLSHHLTQSINLMRNGIFHTGTAWFEDQVQHLVATHNTYHATHVFTKNIFNQVGGYPEIDESRLDLGLMSKFTNLLGNYSTNLSESQFSYIYRWGTAKCYHGSGWGSDMSNHAINHVRSDISNNTIPIGLVFLRPNWKYDYNNLAKQYAH